MKEKLLRGSHAAGLAVRIVVSVFIIAVIIWKYDDLKNMDIRALVEASSSVFAGVMAVWGVYLLKSLVFVVPASLVYIAVGMAFPTHWAILINAVGIILEVCATYLFGVIMGGPYVINKLEKAKHGDKILKLHGKNKLSAIFAIRVLPVFPIDLVSLFLGAVRMKFLPYLLISFGGIMPRVILFTILGDGLYDYIPMQKIVLVAAILLPIALVIWIIRYAMKMNKKEDEYGKSPYEPLKDSRRYVIFDTDIGPDCDDAGAMAVMFELAKKYDIKILGAANCTSNPYGNGAIRAIAEHFGHEDFAVGQHTGYEILKNGDKYNKPVTKKYMKYENSAVHSKSALEFYKKALSKAEENSVTVISVGPLTNLAEIIREEPELFNKKVNSIVAMAGKFPDGKEFNIECDPQAAKAVVDGFKNLIVFSGFEVGNKVMTGFTHEAENNPVFDCYKHYLGKKEPPYLRESWDLTAVHYAFEGEGEYYALSKPVRVSIDEKGSVSTEKDKYSKRYYLIKKAENGKIAEYLNSILENPPC
ncbi:MAG: nucleoside hydrolase [Clostridia bacterium]|nr:nucleoside hydrolase [Clostridia bacterium]